MGSAKPLVTPHAALSLFFGIERSASSRVHSAMKGSYWTGLQSLKGCSQPEADSERLSSLGASPVQRLNERRKLVVSLNCR